MILIDMYIRWKLKREIRAWNKFRKTHYYVGDKEVVAKVNAQ